MALPAYRHLLRSITIAFRSDTRLLTSALSTARSSFESSRSLPPTDLPAKIAHAEEVALILRRNVVQGVADGEKFRKSESKSKNAKRGLFLYGDAMRCG